MTALALLTLALFAGSTYSGESNRIIGGWPTTVEKYPAIVQVEFRGVFSGLWTQSCAANILTNFHVLSAAHCFVGINYNPSMRRIRAGTTYRMTGGVVIDVLREHNHPNYGTLGYEGDLSIIRLTSAMVFSPVLQQGLYPAQGYKIPDNSAVVHAGWGHTEAGNSQSASHELLETTIYTVNNELCAERYASLNRTWAVVTENMICAGLLDEGGRDACQGDSGGPLYYNDGSRGDIVVGIVSWGEGCANDTFPGVSIAISSYTAWIVENAV